MKCQPAMQVQALYPSRAEKGVHDLAGSLPGAHGSASLSNFMIRACPKLGRCFDGPNLLCIGRD